MKKLLVSGVLAVIAALVWNTLPASAHHPEVEVVTLCPEGIPTIDVTAKAWESAPFGMSEDHRINTDILVEVDGPSLHLEQSGAFVAPNYSFTSRFALPTSTIGQTLTVTVTAIGNWGPNGEYPSYPSPTDEAFVTIPPTCDGGTGGSSTTTEAPTTTEGPGSSTTEAPATTEAPTSTEAPDTSSAPTTAPSTTGPSNDGGTGGTQIETEVAGITEVRPQVPGASAAAAQAGGQLAFTGNDTGPLVLGSAGLLAIGAGLILGARKRRQAAA